jgi:hypothetical protein
MWKVVYRTAGHAVWAAEETGTIRVRNSQYCNCRRLGDACLYVYETEDDAVDQQAVRRLWHTRVRVPTTSVLSSVLRLCMRTCACRELSCTWRPLLQLTSHSLPSWQHHNQHNIQWLLATVAVGPVAVSNPSHWWRTQFDSRSIMYIIYHKLGFSRFSSVSTGTVMWTPS